VPTSQIKLNDHSTASTSYLERQYKHLQNDEGIKQRSRDKRQDVDLQQAQPLSQTIYSAQQATIPPGQLGSMGSSLLVQ